MLVSGVRPPMCRRPAPTSIPGAETLSRSTALFGKEAAFLVLALLADVEAGHRPVVAHDAGPDFARLALVVGKLDGCAADSAVFSAGKVAHGCISWYCLLYTSDAADDLT